MTKIIKHRKLHGLESDPPHFAGFDYGQSLSEMLESAISDKIFLCGKPEQMTRDWMMEPLRGGWEISGEFTFKHRTAVYYRRNPPTKRITVKLASHRDSWFPGCENATVGVDAWVALRSGWPKNVPLLSSPAATGKALLWENLPCKDGAPVEFPSIDDDLARLMRANSPQHRIEWHLGFDSDLARERRIDSLAKCVQYDGRWMYAAMCGLDRFPVGKPTRVGHFREYTPGIYDVTVRIPSTWNHIGLIPARLHDVGWSYLSTPGMTFRTWAFEPEFTLALKHGWEIMDLHDGYAFEKGRPLLSWSNKLIEMRKSLQWSECQYSSGGGDFDGMMPYHYAASACRQILNHTIGALHRNDYEREQFVRDDNFRQWRREHPDLAGSETRTPEKVEGGYLVPTFVQDNSPLSIYMPHWTSTLYSLARARVAEWALRCKPETLVKINGDAIYSTVEQPELDKLDTQRLGQPRRK